MTGQTVGAAAVGTGLLLRHFAKKDGSARLTNRLAIGTQTYGNTGMGLTVSVG